MQMLGQQDKSTEEQHLLHMLIHSKEAISVAVDPRYSPRNGPGAVHMLLHACQSSRHMGPFFSMPEPMLHAHPHRLVLAQLPLVSPGAAAWGVGEALHGLHLYRRSVPVLILLGAPGADFIVDYTQVQQVSANTFNVVLVRNPYATIVAGDFVAVSAAPASHPMSAGERKCFPLRAMGLCQQAPAAWMERYAHVGLANALQADSDWGCQCPGVSTPGRHDSALRSCVCSVDRRLRFACPPLCV